MTGNFRDFYKILGVKTNSHHDEILKKYRHLAKQYHPDINDESHDTSRKFLLITEAYETLSDPKKRGTYDRLRMSVLKEREKKIKKRKTKTRIIGRKRKRKETNISRIHKKPRIIINDLREIRKGKVINVKRNQPKEAGTFKVKSSFRCAVCYENIITGQSAYKCKCGLKCHPSCMKKIHTCPMCEKNL